MPGRKVRDDCGQLAVMDALVFFSTAMVISTVLLSYIGPPERGGSGSYDCPTDPGEVLEAFLKASLGKEVRIGTPYDVLLSSGEAVGECIFVEAHLLAEGASKDAFRQLNELLLVALTNITGVHSGPHLLVVAASGDSGSPLLAIPDVPANGTDMVAANSVLPGEGGERFLAVLVLCPAAPSEVV